MRRALLILFSCLAALAMVPAAADAYVYFANAGFIGRANNDGTNVEPEFVNTQQFICGVAVDSGHIYWSTPSKEIGRASISGGDIDEDFITASSGSRTCGLAVDSSHIYWTDSQGKAVHRAPIGGPDEGQELSTEPASVCGIAVDSGHMYFVRGSSEPFSLESAPLDFSAAPVFHRQISGNCAVAVDSDFVYWGNSEDYGNSPHTGIGRESPDGLTIYGPIPTDAPVVDLAVDSTYVYWVTHSGGGELWRAPRDGSSPPEDPLFGSIGSEPDGIAVDDLPHPSPPAPPAPPPPPPALSSTPTLKLGRIKLDKAKGTAQLSFTVSGAGKVSLSGKKVKSASANPSKASTVTLPIKPKKPARELLESSGSAKVQFKVTFTPRAGKALTKSRSVKLRLVG